MPRGQRPRGSRRQESRQPPNQERTAAGVAAPGGQKTPRQRAGGTGARRKGAAEPSRRGIMHRRQSRIPANPPLTEPEPKQTCVGRGEREKAAHLHEDLHNGQAMQAPRQLLPGSPELVVPAAKPELEAAPAVRQRRQRHNRERNPAAASACVGVTTEPLVHRYSVAPTPPLVPIGRTYRTGRQELAGFPPLQRRQAEEVA